MTGFHSKQDMAAGKQKEYDPCIGCLVGTVCRTPNCGRLKLPVDHPFRNTKAALIASITACRDMLDAQPVPAREYAPTDPFERWWYYEGSAPPQQSEDHEEHTKRMCQIAWSNGAYVAAQPAQDVDYWIREATAARQAEMALRRELEAQPAQEPPLEMKFWKIEIDWIGVKADADINSAEGRAWFVTQAKGLWRKLPDGKLKRQILIETAELVQIRQNDLATLWEYPEPNFRRNST
jgi:hypothetical protein